MVAAIFLFFLFTFFSFGSNVANLVVNCNRVFNQKVHNLTLVVEIRYLNFFFYIFLIFSV